MTLAECFSQSYAEARAKFLAAAEAASLPLHSHVHPMLGRDGETLAMDVVRVGPADSPAVLVISSACHGVEGFCGSGVQLALMADPDFHADAARAHVALVYVHALNPYGFSWWRRTTHENVDLNRNFVDFSKPLPANDAYERLAHLVVPATWPPDAEVTKALAAYEAEHGDGALQSVITAGQYSHPEGLFYGGHDPTWSHQTLRHMLHDHGGRCARLGWIDVHTGLGPPGHGERIFACRDDAAALSRAKAWWGPEVTSIYDGSSTSAQLTGMCWLAAYDECPQAEHTGIALEFGTLPMPEIIDALRADQWLENHPETDAARSAAIKRRIRDAFYLDTNEWKAQIVDQARQAAQQALAGLGQRP